MVHDREDVPYALLPQAVRTAFESGEYAAWHVDDADKLTREGLETVYVLEVEQRDAEYELVYSEDGVLLRAVPDVKDFIGRKYPGARIVDAEREKGGLEVEIIDGRTPREVYFGAGDAWLRTKTEVRRSEVPAAVMQAFQTSQYAGWEIDDIDHYDSPERQWYLFELEDPQSDREAELRIQADGTIF